MMRKFILVAFSGLAVLGLAGVSEAHTFGAYGAGFGGGFFHPLGGFDHVLAMLGVGLWAGLRGKNAVWRLPASFIAMMGVGGAAGMAGVFLPLAEVGIALSVFIIGIAVALPWNTKVAPMMALAGLFAIFHGYVHGEELPQAALPALYGAGFVLATSLLLMAGTWAGTAMRQAGRPGVHWRVASGGFMAAAGVFFLAGVL